MAPVELPVVPPPVVPPPVVPPPVVPPPVVPPPDEDKAVARDCICAAVSDMPRIADWLLRADVIVEAELPRTLDDANAP